jgi:glycosyltransferase involved in cell wall biosynthesis
MNICIATQEFSPFPGGIATVYDNLTRIFLNAGHKVVVLTIDASGSLSDDETTVRAGVQIITLRKSFSLQYRAWKKVIREGNQNGAFHIAMGLAMRQWLQEFAGLFQIDVVECTDYGGLGSFLAEPNLPPLVVCGHGCLLQIARYDFYQYDLNFWITTWLEKRSFQNADGIIAHNETNKKDLAQWATAETHVCAIPWIEPSLENADAATSYDILVVGRLQVMKGALTCAEAMEQVAAALPNCKLLWIGKDTYTAPKGMTCSRFIRKHHKKIWQKNFTWSDSKPRSEIISKMLHSKVIAIPSDWDCYSMTTLEAASLGKVLVLTQTTGASHLFERGEALIVPAKDPGRLAEALVMAIEDAERRKQMESAVAGTLQILHPDRCISERLQAYSYAFERHARQQHSQINWDAIANDPAAGLKKIRHMMD